jgi:hypothetical protein
MLASADPNARLKIEAGLLIDADQQFGSYEAPTQFDHI